MKEWLKWLTNLWTIELEAIISAKKKTKTECSSLVWVTSKILKYTGYTNFDWLMCMAKSFNDHIRTIMLATPDNEVQALAELSVNILGCAPLPPQPTTFSSSSASGYKHNLFFNKWK
jgi:hypothetical protein